MRSFDADTGEKQRIQGRMLLEKGLAVTLSAPFSERAGVLSQGMKGNWNAIHGNSILEVKTRNTGSLSGGLWSDGDDN